MSSLRVKLEIIAGIIAVVILAILFYSWLAARDAGVKAEALQVANEKIISANDAQIKLNDQQIKLLAGQLEQLKADQARQLLTLQATFSRAQTPVQSASLTDVLLALKAGETKVGGTAAAPTLETPKAALQAYEQVCEECKIKLPNLTAQLANVTAARVKSEQDNQLLILDKASLTQERDQWKTAAKGGSKWQRFKKAVLWISIGAGAGAVAAKAAHL